MSEVKDPAIKLFGKTIQLLLPDDVVVSRANEKQQQQRQQLQLCSSEHTKKSSEGLTTTQKEDACSRPSADSSIDLSTSSRINNNDPKTPTTDKEASLKNTSKKEHPTEKPNSDGKPQKPDKILPCPRCNSMDTKFCYYNNYNVNQPRHFCKKCQRYWTDGGTMRNMPVGSGRRKNKSSSLASHYRHIVTSDALQGPCYLHPLMKSNDRLLMCSSDVPLCESMNSSLNLSDKSHKKEDHPTLSSSSASDSTEKGGDGDLRNFQGYPLQVPCFPAPPCPYPWNSAQYRPPMAAPTNLGPSGFPVSICPPPQYWGCTVPEPWSVPLVTPPPNQFAPTSSLGKHSRDGTLLSPSSRSGNEEFLKEKDSESGILVPKTLRINVPNEEAKSSLWSTLEIIKDENSNSTSGGYQFKAFQSKVDEKRNEISGKSLATLQANPAALSRSLNFHETS